METIPALSAPPLNKLMEKKRKLKRPQGRRVKEKYKYNDFITEIGKRTGFSKKDIREVFSVGMDIIIEAVKSKRVLILPKIGMFYPMIKTARPVMAFNGGVGEPQVTTMPNKWQMKFKASNACGRKLSKMIVTEEEIDNLYED